MMCIKPRMFLKQSTYKNKHGSLLSNRDGGLQFKPKLMKKELQSLTYNF